MNIHIVIRHIIGYIVGISVFFICIPIVIYVVAQYGIYIIDIPLFKNDIARLMVSFFIFSIGLFFSLWSNIELVRIGKGGPTDAFNIPISPRTQHLVVSGPYKYTRNPMVFGAINMYTAIALYLNSFVAVCVILLCVPIVAVYLKQTEEKRLERDFGDEFREYRRKVSMIIPLPPKS